MENLEQELIFNISNKSYALSQTKEGFFSVLENDNDKISFTEKSDALEYILYKNMVESEEGREAYCLGNGKKNKVIAELTKEQTLYSVCAYRYEKEPEQNTFNSKEEALEYIANLFAKKRRKKCL